MTVVLPDGRILRLGKSVCKTSSGYSLLQLMIGSEGTLGIITELSLKLVAKPEMDVSLILPYESLETGIAAGAEDKTRLPGAAVHRVYGLGHRGPLLRLLRQTHFPG